MGRYLGDYERSNSLLFRKFDKDNKKIPMPALFETIDIDSVRL